MTPLRFVPKNLRFSDGVLSIFYNNKYLGEIYPETSGEFVLDYFDGDAYGSENEGYSTSTVLRQIADKLDELNKDKDLSGKNWKHI